MSNEKNRKEAEQEVVREVQKVAKPLTVETFYTREEIQATPSAFGVDAEVLAGALFGVEGDQLTRSQVKTAIEKFKTRKV